MSKEVKSNNSAAPVEASIRQKLLEQFSPVHLEILNESYMHNVPKGAETHFKVVVVSDKFADLPLIKRHRMVNETLQEELHNGVHALSIMVSFYPASLCSPSLMTFNVFTNMALANSSGATLPLMDNTASCW